MTIVPTPESIAIITSTGTVYSYTPQSNTLRQVSAGSISGNGATFTDIDFSLTGFFGVTENNFFEIDATNTTLNSTFIGPTGQATNAFDIALDVFPTAVGAPFVGITGGSSNNIFLTQPDGVSGNLIQLGDAASGSSAGDIHLNSTTGEIISTTTSGRIVIRDLPDFNVSREIDSGLSDIFGVAEADGDIYLFSRDDVYVLNDDDSISFVTTLDLDGVVNGAGTVPSVGFSEFADFFGGTVFNDVRAGFGGDDGLFGGLGDDRLGGGLGNDFLSGGEGNDRLEGDEGNDFLEGGDGDDIILGDGDFTQTATNTVTVAETGQVLGITVTVPDASNLSTIEVSGFINRNPAPDNDFNLVYVIDVSGSTGDQFSGDETVPDLNGDGQANDIIDSEILAFQALNQSLIDAGLSGVDLTIISFQSFASTVFTGTVGGGVDQVLTSLRSGGGTDFEDALQATIVALNNAGSGQNNVFFLSDGMDSSFGIADEVATLIDPNGLDTQIRAIGLGNGADLDTLDLLDDGIANNSAERVLSPSELTASLVGSPVDENEIQQLVVFVNGFQQAVLTPDQFTVTPLGFQYEITLTNLNLTASDVVTVELIASDGAATTVGATLVIPQAPTGEGADTILAGNGNDFVDGNGADDTIFGEAGNDLLEGGSGFDLVIGGLGDDRVDGDGDNDILEGNEGNDTVNGGTGNDTIFGGDGDNLLNGESGDDVLIGGADNDSINGGDGDDVLIAGNTLIGVNSLQGDAGNDLLIGGSGFDTLFGNEGNDVLEGNGNLDILVGGTGNDVLLGGGDNDTLFGGSGIDALLGGTGNDTLFGDSGNDTLIGGIGDDTLNGGSGDDQLIAQFGTNVLNGDDGNDFLEGAAGFDQLNGGSGGDFILGGIGNDTINGGSGNDFLVGGADIDTFVFDVGDDGATIADFTDGVDRLDLTAFNFTSFNDVLDSAVQVGNNVFFDFGNGDTLTVENFVEAQFAGDILF